MQKRLFNIFFFVFVLLMFNRELNLFGVDLRIIALGIGFLILITNLMEILKNKNYDFKLDKSELLIFSFYFLALICNIMWNFNGLTVDKQNFDVIFISYLFNLVSFIIFFFNKKYFDIKKLWRNVFISSLFLLFSMVITNFGIDITKYLFSGCRGYAGDVDGNFLGGKIRIAGYAEDPNYASLFMVLTFATHFYYNKLMKNKLKFFDIFYYGLLIFGFLISSSKTVMIAIIISLIVCNLKKLKKLQPIFIIFALMGPIVLIALKVNLFSSMITMAQRLSMWEDALDLFIKNPILGNGLTSFRSYFAANTSWYVQSHSTIFQIISETGIISFIIFMAILIRNINIKNKYIVFITSLYTISMITTETVYHAYFIFIIGILPMLIKELIVNEKKSNHICC